MKYFHVFLDGVIGNTDDEYLGRFGFQIINEHDLCYSNEVYRPPRAKRRTKREMSLDRMISKTHLRFNKAQIQLNESSGGRRPYYKALAAVERKELARLKRKRWGMASHGTQLVRDPGISQARDKGRHTDSVRYVQGG